MKKRILALALALIMLISMLASCKNTETGNEDTDSKNDETIAVDLSEYCIIYSKDTISPAKKQANMLQSQINEALSVELSVKTDAEASEQ